MTIDPSRRFRLHDSAMTNNQIAFRLGLSNDMGNYAHHFPNGCFHCNGQIVGVRANDDEIVIHQCGEDFQRSVEAFADLIPQEA